MMTDTKPQILIVDDEELIGELVMRWLTGVGYGCASTQDAENAMTLMSHTDFDLMLLDVRMPGKSGLELLPEVKSRYPGTPVVMMTGAVDKNIAAQAIERGAYEYLIKPFDLMDLAKAVQDALRSRLAASQEGKGRRVFRDTVAIEA